MTGNPVGLVARCDCLPCIARRVTESLMRRELDAWKPRSRRLRRLWKALAELPSCAAAPGLAKPEWSTE